MTLKPEKLATAVTRFNDREFLEASELFEEIWREVGSDEQPFFDAVTRIAAALHLRVHRGGIGGSVNLLQQALVRLDDLRPECGGVDTEALFVDTTAYLDALRAKPQGSWWPERFRLPKIRFARS